MTDKQMVTEATWAEFREKGLLWWINRILQTFGWAIVCEVDQESGGVLRTYPARVRFRGFDEGTESDGFIKVTHYLASVVDELEEEVDA